VTVTDFPEVTQAFGALLFSMESGSGSISAIFDTSYHAWRTMASLTAASETAQSPNTASPTSNTVEMKFFNMITSFHFFIKYY
jgi:hypothetical protein